MDRAPVVDESFEFGDEMEDEAAARELQAERIMETRDAFRQVFSTPQGELALTYLYEYCRQGVSTFVAGDPYETARREGMGRVYLQIAGFVMMTDEKVFDLSQSQSRERNRR